MSDVILDPPTSATRTEAAGSAGCAARWASTRARATRPSPSS